jgi:hypothetical protein
LGASVIHAALHNRYQCHRAAVEGEKHVGQANGDGLAESVRVRGARLRIEVQLDVIDRVARVTKDVEQLEVKTKADDTLAARIQNYLRIK